MLARLSLLGLLLSCSSAAQQAGEPRAPVQAAQPTDPADLRELVEEVRARHGLPALAGAIVTREGLVAAGASGLRAVGSGERAEVTDLWHLGSCTKAVTATLAARLVERGALRFETTLGETFGAAAPPERRVESFDAGWSAVTLRLLLQNRAGAPAGLPEGLWMRLRFSRESPREQRRALVEGVLAHPPECEPDSEFRYSNAGFVLAGAMLEEHGGADYEALLERELLAPLRMDAVGYGAPGEAASVSQPRGHRWHDADGWRAVEPGPFADNPAALGPAGTLHASLADWALFARAHLRGAAGESNFLSGASWSALHTPPEGGAYALGWGVVERPWAGGRALTHAGSNTLWYCVLWLAPERGFGVLAATNAAGESASKACDELCSALVRLHLDPSPRAPATPPR